MESIFDYVNVKKLNLDIDELRKSCVLMHDYIKDNISPDPKKEYSGQSTMTTKLYSQYNVLMYSFPQFYELYEAIKETFNEAVPKEEREGNKYYIQCWLNYYREGEFIDWHGHWPSRCNSWHGFVCVDVEPSVTTYSIPGKGEVDVNNRDNTIVISRSDNDMHRTWPWPYADRIRMTIAFDIVPREHVDPNAWVNHWVPL